jgi:hypothetical protein
MPDLASWFTWGPSLAWTLITLAVSWGIGHLLGAVLISRVPGSVPESRRALVHSSAQLVRRRLPRWCLLIGVWVVPATGR